MNYPTISFDLDDTLNWMSKELAREAGLDYIPNYDDAKAGRVPAEYNEARDRCFMDPDFWAKSPKTENANLMIAMTKACGFKPIICTKIPRSLKGFSIPAGGKVQWQQENFPDIDMLMAAGQKHSDSRALVDDSMKNCRLFNQEQQWYRPALKWDNSRPSLIALLSLLKMSRDYTQTLVNDPKSLVVLKTKDTGEIITIICSDGEDTFPSGILGANETPKEGALRTLKEESGIVIDDAEFIMTLVNRSTPIHCFYAEIETICSVVSSRNSTPVWQEAEDWIHIQSPEYKDFNTVLLYNLGLID